MLWTQLATRRQPLERDSPSARPLLSHSLSMAHLSLASRFKKETFLLIQLLLSFFPLLGQAAGWNISSCGDPRPAYLRISSDWLLASLLVQRHDDEVCGQSGQAYDSKGGAIY